MKLGVILVKIGEFIRKSRKELGLTLKELAEKIEISYTYLSQIELGDRVASPSTLKKIAGYLPNTSYSSLLKLSGYEDLATAEKLKEIERDFSDELELRHVSINFLEKVQDIFYLLKMEEIDLLDMDLKPKFKGRELSPAEREQVLKMLEVLFPEA